MALETPYKPGGFLHLHLPELNQPVQVRIEHLYQPFTSSVVLTVSFVNQAPPCLDVHIAEHVVLKMYDRRFAEGLRKQWRPGGRHTQDLEQAYIDSLVQDPPMNEDNEEDDAYYEEEGGDSGGDIALRTDASGDAGQQALIEQVRGIQDECLAMFRNEQAVYDRLRPLQAAGKVPTYLSTVQLIPDHPEPKIPAEPLAVLEYALIPGCLMTLVEGQTLRNIKSTVPKRDWLYVVTQATLAINEIGDYEVLNDDTRIDNILIQKNPKKTFASSLAPAVENIIHSNDGEAGGQPTTPPKDIRNNMSGPEYNYGIVLFDFAHARLRRPDESLLEWRDIKFRADEEGLIGGIMHELCGMTPFPRPGPGTRRYFVPRSLGKLVPEDEIENRLIKDERDGGRFVVQSNAADG